MTKTENLIIVKVETAYTDGMKFQTTENNWSASSSADGKGRGFGVQEPIVKGDRTHKQRMSQRVLEMARDYYINHPTELAGLIG